MFAKIPLQRNVKYNFQNMRSYDQNVRELIDTQTPIFKMHLLNGICLMLIREIYHQFLIVNVTYNTNDFVSVRFLSKLRLTFF